MTQHVTESSDTHSSSRVKQHNSISRTKKAAAKLHVWIPAASSSGLRLLGRFFVTGQNEFKNSRRTASAIACCSMGEGGRGERGGRGLRNLGVHARSLPPPDTTYPAARRTAAPNVTTEGVSGNGCRLAASHISTQKRLLPSLLSFQRGVYVRALGLAKAVATWPGSAATRIAMSRDPVRRSWTTGGSPIADSWARPASR